MGAEDRGPGPGDHVLMSDITVKRRNRHLPFLGLAPAPYGPEQDWKVRNQHSGNRSMRGGRTTGAG